MSRAMSRGRRARVGASLTIGQRARNRSRGLMPREALLDMDARTRDIIQSSHSLRRPLPMVLRRTKAAGPVIRRISAAERR